MEPQRDQQEFTSPVPAEPNPSSPAPKTNNPGDSQPRSPIRPIRPATDALPRPRLVPAKPSTGPLDEAKHTGRQASAVTPHQAIERIRQRMTAIAQEFADGKINRAQFHAIYNRYGEQRRIIETLLTRDPNSDAWQQVARPGHTNFLRQHFASRVLFFAVFALGDVRPIAHYGSHPPNPADVLPILRILPDFLKQKGPLGPACKRVAHGHWLMFVPGQQAVTTVLYSLEPSAQQIAQAADLHGDFERANAQALSQRDHAHERLVFPQRGLFEL